LARHTRFQGAGTPAALVAPAGHSTSLYGSAGADAAPPALPCALTATPEPPTAMSPTRIQPRKNNRIFASLPFMFAAMGEKLTCTKAAGPPLPPFRFISNYYGHHGNRGLA